MIEKTLVLSTAHISRKTDEILTGLSGEENIDLPRVQSHQYGYIIFLISEPYDEKDFTTMPELFKLIQFAQLSGCTMINIDRDADILKCFKTYEW